MDLRFLPAVINEKPTAIYLRAIAKQEIRIMRIALKVADNIHMRCRLAEAQNWRCCWCGTGCRPEPDYHNSATIEHVHPRSLGGADAWENYAMACAGCNHKRGTLSVEDFMSGRLVTDGVNRAERQRRKRFDKHIKKARERNQTGWRRADGTPLCPEEWLASLNVGAEGIAQLREVVYE